LLYKLVDNIILKFNNIITTFNN